MMAANSLKRPKTVLCAEDEPKLRRDLAGELSDAGYRVIEAGNGEDALQAIAAERPDIVLCDISMPRMTGLEVLERVRASNDDFAEVPFIFLTAYGEKGDHLRGRSLGADDYLVKPIDYDLLLSTVNSRLESVARAQRRLADHAHKLEHQLADMLAGTRTRMAPALPGADALRARLAAPDLPGCHLVLASIDAYHRLAPQLGSLAAKDLLQRYLGEVRAVSGDDPAALYQFEDDVFALLIEGERDWAKVSARVEGLIDTTLEVTDLRVPVTSSIAIATYRTGDARAAASMLEDSLLALRFAQRNGGHNLVRVDEPVRDRLRIMQFIEENIGRAIARDEFRLAFQPKVRMSDRRLVGAEALIRWHSPCRGLISPGLFIPMIEKTGFVREVSDWVLDKAAEAGKVLMEAGLATPIAVNASGAELHRQFAARVENALARHDLPPSLLEVEITETSVVLDLDFASQLTAGLRQQGISIAIDDFGTGYSSLSYLRAFPLDAVKIDQSFVRGIGTNAIDRKIVESVIGLTKAIGVATIAEGVETQAQFDALREMGCDMAQGYLLARPLDFEDFRAFRAG